MRLYEDFQVGEVYRSAVARTVTETDNLLFTMLTMNTNELHFNEEAASRTEWGRILVNSCFTLSLVLGLSVADTSQAGAVNLGWESIRLPHPVFVGDTLRAETEVLAARESGSRPAQGIVTVRTRGVNQRGETVVEFERSFLIAKRSA
jgi:itaconyl-CoA hydratase